MTVIETPRLRLRELDAADSARLYDLFADRHVMRHYPTLRSDWAGEQWQAAVRRMNATYGYGPWTLELRDGTFVGQCGPFPHTIDGKLEIEIVCFLLRPFWRYAYADEASLACARYAFERMRVPRVIALIVPENRPSVRLARRCGLTFERLLEYDGTTMALYVLQPSNFRTSREHSYHF